VTANYSDTTVIVPTLNEEANIGRLLDAVTELYPSIHVTVVDDGSRDRTQDAVRTHAATHPNVRLLDRTREPVHGLTASVVDGALAVATPYFVVIDGDLQHPPEKIGELRDRLLAGADVVVGRREKVLVPWPWHRHAISWTGVRLGRLRLLLGGAPTSDTMSGFFATRADLFRRYAAPNVGKFEPRGYKVLFDFLKLLPSSTRMDEVPYEFGQRAGGTSKIGTTHLLVYARSLFRF
jgi:dolichol-phosphate mannosyltransferase